MNRYSFFGRIVWKIETFWRVFLLILADLFLIVEWPVKLITNWIIFLTIWSWVGFLYMGIIVYRAINEKTSGEREALLGKIWWLDQYKLY